jgi:hypothetical protein
MKEERVIIITFFFLTADSKKMPDIASLMKS